MELKKQNVLLFPRTMDLGGTEQVVLQLCAILQPRVNRVVVVSRGGVHEKALAQMGIRHVTIPDIERKSPGNILTVLRTVASVLREEKITVVHTHHRMAAFYTRLLGLTRRFTAINTSHNTFTDKRSLTRFALGAAHRIACGEAVKRNLEEVYGLSPVTVLHNAVEAWDGETVPDPRLQALRAQGCALVGNVGRLSKQKGMEYFLRAVPMVKEHFPKTKFILVGDGEDAGALEALCDTLGIREDVVFLGYRPDIRNVMRQLDFLVLSSLWEGLPLTPMEAFSVGKTVVGTAVDGTVEVISHEQNGLLVPPKDPGAIAGAVKRLLGDPALRERCEAAACQTFLEEFSFDTYTRRVTDFYESID